jgi:uncharacterized protein
MLTSTFIHIPGVGPITEQRLWASGVTSWRRFFDGCRGMPLSQAKLDHIRYHLDESEKALENRDYRFFARHLAPRNQWRAFPDFSESMAYLDIETTGMGFGDAVTMVGLYDGRTYRAYIHGVNLHQFPEDIGQYSLIATYFGGSFDLPFLQRYFPFLRFDQIHIDLCPLLHRLGHRGGLKRVEEQIGIQRSEETHGLSGFDAVRLWWSHKRGDPKALDLLVQYNREDVMNLQALLHYAYRMSAQHLRAPFQELEFVSSRPWPAKS